MLTTKDWLTPGEIRELCMGGSDAELLQQEAEEAHGWVLRYIAKHGRDGHICTGEFLGFKDGRVQYGPDTPAPEIPDAIARTLHTIGGSLRGGIDRIGLCETKEQSFVKRDFVQAYVRIARLA